MSTETVVILINGKPQRVRTDWVWENCDGRGGRKTVADFEQVPEAPVVGEVVTESLDIL